MRLWLLHRNPLAGRAHDILLHRILTSLLLSWPDHISCPTKRTSEGYKGLRASNLSWLRRPPPSLPRVRANISQQIIRSRAAQTRQTWPMSDQFFKVWVRSHSLTPAQGPGAHSAARLWPGAQVKVEFHVPRSITRHTKAFYSRSTCIVILTWSVW